MSQIKKAMAESDTVINKNMILSIVSLATKEIKVILDRFSYLREKENYNFNSYGCVVARHSLC